MDPGVNSTLGLVASWVPRVTWNWVYPFGEGLQDLVGLGIGLLSFSDLRQEDLGGSPSGGLWNCADQGWTIWVGCPKGPNRGSTGALGGKGVGKKGSPSGWARSRTGPGAKALLQYQGRVTLTFPFPKNPITRRRQNRDEPKDTARQWKKTHRGS